MDNLFGKYRGKVIDNIDPLKQGRLKVQVAILENNHVWALPCVPYAGKDVGLFFMPPKDANIWVEFEAGNIQKPIWSGCFWSEGELPTEITSPNIKLIKMPGITLKLDDKGITFELSKPAAMQTVSFKLTSDGIELLQGMTSIKVGANSGISLKHNQHSVEMAAASVNINKGALEIM